MRDHRPLPLLFAGALALALAFQSLAGAAYAQAPSLPAPVPQAGAQPLSLADTITRALTSSPRLRAAEADRNAQVERRRGAWSDTGPRLEADFNAQKYSSPESVQFGPQNVLLRPEINKTGSLILSQPITGGFALVDKARFEGTQLEVREAGLTLARGDVAFEASETWLHSYAAQRQLAIAEQSIVAAETQMKDAFALERAGRMNHGDTLKLQLAVSQARSRAAQARAARDMAFSALREEVGLPVGAPVEPGGALPEVPPAPEALAAVKTALQARLEPLQARSGVEAAEFGRSLAYTNFVPTVNAFWRWDHTFGDLSALGGARDTKYIGLAATWALWNDGAHVFAVREAAANVVKAEELGRGVDQQIRLDVLTALANLTASHESLALAKVAVSQAEEAYRIEQVRFRTGTRSATDLILAETSRSSAQASLVSAQTDLVFWHLKLQKALGAEQPKL